MAGTGATDITPFTATGRAGITSGIAAITLAGTSTVRATIIIVIIVITAIGAEFGFLPVRN